MAELSQIESDSVKTLLRISSDYYNNKEYESSLKALNYVVDNYAFYDGFLESKKRIHELEDMILKEKINQTNSIDSVNKFINSIHDQSIRLLASEKTRSIISQSDSIEVLRTYLKQKGHVEHYSIAKTRLDYINNLNENTDYLFTKNAGTSVEWKNFIQKYPDHPEFAKIKREIIKLEVDEIFIDNQGKAPVPILREESDNQNSKIYLKNDSKYTLTISFSGPEEVQIILPPNRKHSMQFINGDYRVAILVTSPLRKSLVSRLMFKGNYDWIFENVIFDDPEVIPINQEHKTKLNINPSRKHSFMLPKSLSDQIVMHEYFTLSYSEKHEQAEWVAYKITKENFRSNIDRTNDYREDPFVKTKSADLIDYKGNGYDMGHLAPAATMSHNIKSMSESFYLSNISPQKAGFNRGIWKRLEEKVRYWSYFNDSTFVVTGPVLENPIRSIGHNEVSVPKSFYKTLIGYRDGKVKGIAFIMPNQSSEKSIYLYATSIDEIEKITGIDFYHNLNGQIQNEIEANDDLKKWALK